MNGWLRCEWDLDLRLGLINLQFYSNQADLSVYFLVKIGTSHPEKCIFLSWHSPPSLPSCVQRYIQNQALTSPHTGNPSFDVFVLTYFFFSWLETDLATYLLMQKSAFLGHRTYLLTCRRSVAGGARVLTYLLFPELVFAYPQLLATVYQRTCAAANDL